MANQQIEGPTQDELKRIEFKRGIRKVRRKIRERQGEIKELNITAMMDMMTIILVFLLKSWSSSNTTVEVNTTMTPPTSTTQLHPDDTLTITVSQKAILVGDKVVAELEGTPTAAGCPGPLCAVGVKIPKDIKDQGSDDSYLITPLYDRLQKEVDKLEYIAKYNPRAPFNGRVTIIADRWVPYRLLTEVLYTAGKAKLDQYRFLVLTKENSGS
ncbi:MAG TPA: biopolymer transporter ExbD [Myxococcales bacterium]|nr:biopolymer transporter ExbD [Myxococcales bacterium]